MGQLVQRMDDPDSGVRYWAATGLLIRGDKVVMQHRRPLLRALQDVSPSVRIAAAEALVRYGKLSDVDNALDVLVELADIQKHGAALAIAALNALDACGSRADRVAERVAALPHYAPDTPRRMRSYVIRLLEKFLGDRTLKLKKSR